MNLKGKNVVLTGASSGIGLDLLPLLHAKGAHVLAVGRKPYQPEFDSIHYIQADISTQEGVDFVFSNALERFNTIDIFIANAGFAYYEDCYNGDWNHARSIFDTNVFSPIYAFQKLKALKKEEPFQFAVTASAVSYMPLPGYALYSGTKHAVRCFFQSAHLELPKHQIITLIHPVATKTAFFKKDAPIPFPSQTSKAVANHFIRGIEKDVHNIFPFKPFIFMRNSDLLKFYVQKRETKSFMKWRQTHE
jgi:uncharacterized protein